MGKPEKKSFHGILARMTGKRIAVAPPKESPRRSQTKKARTVKKPTLKEKLLYWLDGKISDGSLGLIKLLTIVTVVIALVVASIMQALSIPVLGQYNTFGARLYTSFATIINGFMPYYNEGDVKYRILTVFNTIYSLFVTSMLIGVIATGIQEKLNRLKKGNVAVMEEGHIVVLGFRAGEYALIQELVYGADKRRCCIVVAGDGDREEMEDCIRDNIKCPKNVRILCRSVNIFDPHTLERCAISTCRTVLISPADNDRTIRTLLAVIRLLHNVPEQTANVIAVLSKDDYRIPPDMLDAYHILLLHTNETIAKIMAHSCTQPGLPQTLLEMFHFEGSEMHIISLPDAEGLTFEELIYQVDDAFPLGICKGKDILINPDPGTVLEKGDRLLVFCEENDSAKFVARPKLPPLDAAPVYGGPEDSGRVAVIGHNAFLSTILQELPENVPAVTLVNVGERFREEALQAAAGRETPLAVTFFDKDISAPSALEEVAKLADHIVVLSPRDRETDEADMQNIFMVMTLRDIRNRLGLRFNITVELRRETNQNLLIPDLDTEFVVSSNMSSLFLAQLSESPELLAAFDELLTNEGNEIYLKTAKELHCEGTRSVLEIRRRLLPQRYVMIGYMDAGTMESFFELSLDDTITLKPQDKLIVIGEN